MFILKPDSLLRFCINYKALNNITVKNKYFLLLIGEILDRLSST
jgi:hypothetical protein